MTVMVKHATVLNRDKDMGDGFQNFINSEREEEPEDRTYHSARSYIMSDLDWIDMGRPDVITVTVEIGDALNEGS